eukprot:6927127-Pyramimonas_sp.AAC.1
MARYQLAMELMGQAEKVAGGDAMGFIYTWLRLSNLKLLDWYRNGNYQSKDMGWCQKSIAEMLHGIQVSASSPCVVNSPPQNFINFPQLFADAACPCREP